MTLVFAAVLVAAVLAGGGLVLTRLLRNRNDQDVATDRLERYLATPVLNVATTSSARASLQRLRGVFQSTVARWLEGSPSSDRLAEQLNHAEIQMRASEWSTLRLITTLFLAWLLWSRLEGVVGLIAGGAIGYFAPGFFLRWRIGRRRQLFDDQLGEVVNQLANCLRAGQSMKAAIIYVAQDVPDPMGIEFRRMVHEMALGRTQQEAIDGFVERTRSNEVFLLASAIEIQHQVGGNLAENLDQIAKTIRERTRVRSEIRTYTAQARGSAWVISLIPIGLAGFLDLAHPTYFNPMLTTAIGIWALIICAVSMSVGIYIITRIVDIKI